MMLSGPNLEKKPPQYKKIQKTRSQNRIKRRRRRSRVKQPTPQNQNQLPPAQTKEKTPAKIQLLTGVLKRKERSVSGGKKYRGGLNIRNYIYQFSQFSAKNDSI